MEWCLSNFFSHFMHIRKNGWVIFFEIFYSISIIHTQKSDRKTKFSVTDPSMYMSWWSSPQRVSATHPLKGTAAASVKQCDWNLEFVFLRTRFHIFDISETDELVSSYGKREFRRSEITVRLKELFLRKLVDKRRSFPILIIQTKFTVDSRTIDLFRDVSRQ